MPRRSVDLIGSQQLSPIFDKPPTSSRKRKRGQEEPEAANQEEQEQESGYQEKPEGANHQELEARNQEEQEGGSQEQQEGGSQEEKEGRKQLEQESGKTLEQEGGKQSEQEVEVREEQEGGYQATNNAQNQEIHASEHISQIKERSSFKQLSISPPDRTPTTVPGTIEEKLAEKTPNDIRINTGDLIEYWILTDRWPEVFFESHGQSWEDLVSESSIEEKMESPHPSVQWYNINGVMMPRPLPKVATLRRKQSDSSLTETCGQTNRRTKVFHTPTHNTLSYLRSKGVTCVNQPRVSQKRAKIFVYTFWNHDRPFSRIHCFAMIYLKNPQVK